MVACLLRSHLCLHSSVLLSLSLSLLASLFGSIFGSILSVQLYSLSYHLRCSEAFAVIRSYSHPSGTLSFNLSLMFVPYILVRFSLSL